MGGGCCIGDFPCCVGFHPIKDLFCSDSCCVGNAPGPTESELHAKKVAEELAEMKEKISESSKKQESIIMNYINKSMNNFLEEVKELNKQSFGGKSLNINTKVMVKKNDALREHAIGCISNVMNKRLVQTDKELSTILAEKDDEKRRKNFDEFVNRIERQAVAELKKEIEQTVKQQSEIISREINTRLIEVNRNMDESVRNLANIREAKQKKDKTLVKIQVESMYQSTLCTLILDALEN